MQPCKLDERSCGKALPSGRGGRRIPLAPRAVACAVNAAGA
ncbi:hypothetical protein [Fretibacterium fastidiosum]